MSTQTNAYTLVGVKIKDKEVVKKLEYETLEPYMDSAFDGIEHHNGLCVIYDGMSCDYICIGRVLAKSDEYCQDMEDVSISVDELEKLIFEVKCLLNENIQPILGMEQYLDDVKLHTFIHYR